MRINNNIQALNAYRNLNANQFQTSKNLEKLSSGLRINRAADDAAGLAISEKMRSQIRGLKQAERNSMDGISLMQTAEGALQEVHAMLQRMRVLAVQGANDTNTEYDREQIQKEIEQLKLEIDSISEKTEFNTRKLLNGSSAVLSSISEAVDNGANVVGNPKVIDPRLESGVYHVKVEDTKEIVKLNQVGAGIANSTDISLDANSSFFPQAFGEYTINVRSFLANETNSGVQHSATIQVIGPNGLPLEERSVAVNSEGDIFSIGGLNINTKNIREAGTIKVSIEQEATFSVYRGDSAIVDTKIAAEKTMTTRNGIIRHGGIEFKFDNEISTANAVGGFTVDTPSSTGAVGAATVAQNTASIKEVRGEYTFDLSAALEDGDSIDIGGVTITATIGGAGANEVDEGDNEIAQAAKIKTILDNDPTFSTKYSVVDNIDGTLTITEKAGQASGTALTIDDTGIQGASLAVVGITEDIVSVQEQLGNSTFSISTAFGDGDQLVIGGVTINFANGAGDIDISTEDTPVKQAAAIKTFLEANGGFDAHYSITDNSDGTLTIAEKAGQAAGTSLSAAITGAGVPTPGEYSFNLVSNVEPGSTVTIGGVTLVEGTDFSADPADVDATAAAIVAALNTNGTFTASATGATITITEATASGTDLTSNDISISGATGTTKFSITNNALAFQIGPNTNQNVMIDVPRLDIVTLGIEEIDVTSQKGANHAIFILDQAINVLSDVRAKLGATQNRMEHTINNLQVTHENLTASESRIRDADMALEMTEFTRNNILNQSATAMLAQANQLPQGVLQLLQ